MTAKPTDKMHALGKRTNSSSRDKTQHKEFVRALLALLRDRLEFLLLDVKVQPSHVAGVLGLKANTISAIRTRALRKRALRPLKQESAEETLDRETEEKRVRLLFEAMLATITITSKKKMSKTAVK